MRLLFSALLVLAGCALWGQKGQEITTKHGFRLILHTNKGQTKPKFEDDVAAHIWVYVGDSLMQSSKSFAPDGYQASLPSEEEFNNSPSAPAFFDAAMYMGVGDSATAYMKLDSFIRESLPPSLKKYTEVRYELTLLKVTSGEIKKKAREQAKAAFNDIAKAVTLTAADYRDSKLTLVTKPSGLKMLVVEPGTGQSIIQGEDVSVHYYGSLTNGQMFDNSFERGEPLPFNAASGQMIPGFDEGVMNLRHGAKAYLFLPPTLAYGDQASGPIPANSELIFYIEIQ